MIYQLGVLFLFGTCMSISAMPNECVCTLEYSPLCGTDGMTYPNKCTFECDRGEATLAYKGECREKRESPPCVCSREARPVCGSDGHTYNNPCMLNCAKEVQEDLHLDHVGNCATVKREVDVQQLPPCACPKNIRRVCASNGVTYNNECLMRCAGAELTVVKGAPCDTE